MEKLVRVRARFPNSCFRLSKARIRVRAPPLRSNPAYNSIHGADRTTNDLYEYDYDGDTPPNTCTAAADAAIADNSGNRIMVVIDSTKQAKGALEWALTHAVQQEDTVLLLHIANPKKGVVIDSVGQVNPRVNELMYSMKCVCRTKRPGVRIESAILKQEKEKGAMIVEAAKVQKASLLVLGHKRRSITWSLFLRWTGKQSSGTVADYCVQNADCMTVAVRRKNRKLGGYLITTKRHKNFWLLA